MTAAPTPSRAGVLQLLGTTPLRDLLRFRLSGRLDIERHLGGLPAPAADLIRAVVKRTRLWGLERVDVARELAAHFADGLAAGRTPDELIRDFGDARVAARLIARAAKRKRPLVWKALVRAVQALAGVVILCVLAYGVLALRYFASHPTISRNYMAELNGAAAEVPAGERALPLYHQAWKQIGRPGEGEDLATVVRPGDPRWPAALAYLHKRAGALELARRAAAMPHLGAPLRGDYDPSIFPEYAAQDPTSASSNPLALVFVRLPYVSEMRQIARHLIADMRLAAVEGDGERAAADLGAILGMADHARERPMLICDLVSFQILSSGLEEFGRILHDRPDRFSESQLIGLAHRIAACCGGGRLTVRYDGERASFDDILQRAFTDDGHGDGHPTAEGAKLLDMLASSSGDSDLLDLRRLAQPVASAVMASRREQHDAFNRVLDSAIARVDRPLWEWGTGREPPDPLEAAILNPTPLVRLRFLPVEIMCPATGYAAMAAERATQVRDATLVAIALTIQRERTGSYPETLQVLVPMLLPAVLPDRFDGAPIRYHVDASGPVLYSVGVDRRDDGGRPPSTADDRDRVSRWIPPATLAADLESPMAAYYRGDWVLWPAPVPAPPPIVDVPQSSPEPVPVPPVPHAEPPNRVQPHAGRDPST